MTFYPEIFLIVFSSGCLFWRVSIFKNESYGYALAQLIITIIFYLFPVDTIINMIIPSRDMITKVDYFTAKKNFSKMYEKTNPAYTNFYQEFKYNILDFIL